jgi:hypothetical protein
MPRPDADCTHLADLESLFADLPKRSPAPPSILNQLLEVGRREHELREAHAQKVALKSVKIKSAEILTRREIPVLTPAHFLGEEEPVKIWIREDSPLLIR